MLSLSWSCSHTSSTRHHFNPSQSLFMKYYKTSWCMPAVYGGGKHWHVIVLQVSTYADCYMCTLLDVLAWTAPATACPPNSNSQSGATSCDCNANYYKSSDGTCLPCPSKSVSQPGSEMCTCVSGYFRISGEGPSEPCTSEKLYVILYQICRKWFLCLNVCIIINAVTLHMTSLNTTNIPGIAFLGFLWIRSLGTTCSWR